MKNLVLLAVVVAVAGLGCKSTRVERVDVDEAYDLSGRWNDIDSQDVAKTMIGDVLSRPWLEGFQSEKGRKPAVVVGGVINRSDEHIATETFLNDIEREFINSGRVRSIAGNTFRDKLRQEVRGQQTHASEETAKRMAQEIGADFMLTGTINTILDTEGGRQVKFYQVDLTLINVETHEKVWIGTEKKKKVVSRRRFGL
jgi:hypothetical protein